jgi:putative oxidoreductase
VLHCRLTAGVFDAARTQEEANIVRILSLPFLHPLRDLGLLSVRLGVGVVMALHGWTKWQAGPEGWLSGGMIAGLGIPAPVVMAWLVLIVELVGGILLVLGVLTRIFSLGTFIVMLVALTQVKGLAFLTTNPETQALSVWGGNIDWVLLFSSLGLALLGPGKIALDALLGIERD